MSTSSSKVKLIATARQKYAGRMVYPGHPFEVDSETEADDLVAMNFARRAPQRAELSIPVATYSRRDMQAETAQVSRRGRRRRYQRSDLNAASAEDSAE